jgi:nucleoside-diphosphate-sugar epimerase
MLSQSTRIVVAGAGGFIGGHLVASLKAAGCTRLRAIDIKPFDAWYQRFEGVENLRLDLRDRADCEAACDGATDVFNLACDMGGIGFIERHKAACMLSVLINTHLLMAAAQARCRRYFYSSSACVYAADHQRCPDVAPLREQDAYPAMPEDGYGWEKLFSERMCRHFYEELGLETRVARYHNVYGPHGAYDGGREKAPAAICRKVIDAVLHGTPEIEIWGDGRQSRSFMYIDDCIEGTVRIMESDVREPLNLGSDESVTINQLVDLAEEIAGVRLRRVYRLDAPQGVRGRNSDNTLIEQRLGWAPHTSLRDGLRRTYHAIFQQMTSNATTDTTTIEAVLRPHQQSGRRAN